MSKLGFVFEWIFKLIGLLFTYMFIRQLVDAVSGDNRYLFFELFFLLAWIVGALIFGVIGFVLGRIRKSNKEEKEEAS